MARSSVGQIVLDTLQTNPTKIIYEELLLYKV